MVDEANLYYIGQVGEKLDVKLQYYKQKIELKTLFIDYVNSHSLAECEELYFFLEDNSQEDALLFAIGMCERYVSEFEHEIYDHISCMVFHSGTHSMLECLLEAEMASTSKEAMLYYKDLISSIISGLEKTARLGQMYSESYLNELRERIKQRT